MRMDIYRSLWEIFCVVKAQSVLFWCDFDDDDMLESLMNLWIVGKCENTEG